jgi:glycine oxidase
VRADQERIPARHVVVAAGAWSPQLEGLPRALPVEPVRGQLLAVRWPAGTPPIIVFHEHSYVLARGQEAIVGATIERVGFDASVTDAGLAQLRAAAARLFPAIALEAAPRTWAGLRPVTPDGRPLVGPEEEAEGLWYATGHGRNGILLAGLTGEIIGDLLATGETEIDWSPLRPR